jgi:hypothetical protein
MILAAAVAAAVWSAPVDVGPAPPDGRVFTGQGLHLGWIEGRRTFVRVTPPRKPHRFQLKRAYRDVAFDARGRGLAVTTITSQRPCRGKRPYRVYVQVQRLGADGSAAARPQSLGDGCNNIGAPMLAVNGAGSAVLAWLEIPGGQRGSNKRVVIAQGATWKPMHAVRNSGAGDAAGHAVAIDPNGRALVAFRRGSRMLVTTRAERGRFGPAQDLGATPQREFPATAAAIDEFGVATVAWTDKCACGEAGMTSPPNPLRVARRGYNETRFGATETLDAGKDIAGPPVVAAGGGAAAVMWSDENDSGGVHVAAGPPFAARQTTEEASAITVTQDRSVLLAGTDAAGVYVRRTSGDPERVAPSGFPRAFLTGLDFRTALLFQDGGRLRLSFSP